MKLISNFMLILPLVLGGCSHLQVHTNWDKPGWTDAEAQRDWNQCKYETERSLAYMPNNSPVAGYKKAEMTKEVLESCFVAKGYYKTYPDQKHQALNSFVIGVKVRELTNNEKAYVERNAGAYVEAVYENTPAWAANVVPGDVIIKINGTIINNDKQCREQLELGKR